MEEKHIEILKNLGFDISQKDLTNDYWKKRGADALALTTQDRDVYGCVDHTPQGDNPDHYGSRRLPVSTLCLD